MSGRTGNNKTIERLILGTGLSLISVIATLCLLAVLMQGGKIPQEAVIISLSICLLISSMLGSITAAIGIRTNRLLFALVPSGILGILMLVGRWFVPVGERGGTVTWPLLFTVLLPGVCIGLYRKKKKRR